MNIREFLQMVIAGNTEFDTLAAEAREILASLDRNAAIPNRKRKLLPDPEGQNTARAQWAASALAVFAHDTGEAITIEMNTKQSAWLRAQNLCDLLVDLMHYCDHTSLDFGERLSTAHQAYQVDTAGKGSQFPAPAVLDARETATVLHALRTVQCRGRIEGCAAGDCEHFAEVDEMTNEEIDELCRCIWDAGAIRTSA